MTERPILMNADMVRAVLDGRKTQTRRPLRAYMFRHIDLSGATPEARGKYQFLRTKSGGEVGRVTNPFGQPGDRLWVRETFFDAGPFSHAPLFYGKPRFQYRADGNDIGCHPWRPSIHMPRWAARIILEITDVRAERVQDITESDALAEGIELPENGTFRDYGVAPEDNEGYHWQRTAVESYRTLWDSLYGPLAWAANPWVWVVEFRRVQP